MSDIQDEAYSEAMDEIARLKSLLAKAASTIWELNADPYPQQWIVDLCKELRETAE